MVDPPGRDSALRTIGYLYIEGQGGRSTADLRGLLTAFEDAHQAVSQVEVAASQVLAEQEWLRRWGPPRRYWPLEGSASYGVPSLLPAPRALIVTRVVLESPGFWEFLGSLNPLEVLRKYLNDRHERRKDRDYREAAEADSLALDNALKRLDVVARIASLEREFGPDFLASEAWRQGWIGHIRHPLERLAEFDERGMINGRSAQAGIEPPAEPQRPPRLPEG